jgi:hypothetical protein
MKVQVYYLILVLVCLSMKTEEFEEAFNSISCKMQKQT